VFDGLITSSSTYRNSRLHLVPSFEHLKWAIWPFKVGLIWKSRFER
jgi:hypothetical protein